jgi:ribosome biogenesis GTPase
LARIVRIDRGFPLAVSESDCCRFELAERLAKRARSDGQARPAVGDWAVLTHPDGHEFARVEALLPRRSAFMRRDASSCSGRRTLIANIDRVFVVQALSDGQKTASLARLERELVLAYESGAKIVVVLTKADLCSPSVIEATVKYLSPALLSTPLIIESAVDGRGIEEIRALVPFGSTAALIGASGVGKSTLINRLVGREKQATGAVRSSDDKGRHTTVAREMVLLPSGGVLIDTPGLRQVALWEAGDGLAAAFPEIAQAAGSCRFADCRHGSEPGCAVRSAEQAGAIESGRLKRYRALAGELDELADARHRPAGRS